MRIFHSLALLAALLTLPVAALFTTRETPEQAEDVSRVRALGQAYASGWLADDREAVLDVFADNAVLVPHLGNPQAKGKAAIRKHFWPPGGPATAIESFALTSKDVVVAGELAYDRGTFELAFTMEGSPDPFTSKGYYVAVSRKGDEGLWRWVVYTWNHP